MLSSVHHFVFCLSFRVFFLTSNFTLSLHSSVDRYHLSTTSQCHPCTFFEAHSNSDILNPNTSRRSSRSYSPFFTGLLRGILISPANYHGLRRCGRRITCVRTIRAARTSHCLCTVVANLSHSVASRMSSQTSRCTICFSDASKVFAVTMGGWRFTAQRSCPGEESTFQTYIAEYLLLSLVTAKHRSQPHLWQMLDLFAVVFEAD